MEMFPLIHVFFVFVGLRGMCFLGLTLRAKILFSTNIVKSDRLLLLVLK